RPARGLATHRGGQDQAGGGPGVSAGGSRSRPCPDRAKHPYRQASVETLRAGFLVGRNLARNRLPLARSLRQRLKGPPSSTIGRSSEGTGRKASPGKGKTYGRQT